MKKRLLALGVACLALQAKSQIKAPTGAELCFVGSLYKDGGVGYGGKFSGNFGVSKEVSLGFGFGAVKLKNIEGIYAPLFGSIRAYFPPAKNGGARAFIQIEPGYGMYSAGASTVRVGNSYVTMNTKGGFYLNTGLGVKGAGATAPYVSLNYTRYGFQAKASSNINSASTSSAIEAFSVNVGVWFGKKKA